MKTTRKPELIMQLDQLSSIIETRRKLEKEEQKIKKNLKQIMDEMETTILRAGDNLAIISERFRTELNKDELLAYLGDEKMREFESLVQYRIFEIKKA